MPRLNLPRPERVVRRSVGVCQRMGYTEAQALGLIQAVCTSVAAGTPTGGEFDLTWLSEIHEVARCRLKRIQLPPS
jgi:hypothetical protein